MKAGKHANIPIFVPHAGCPQQCSFCDQRLISGASEPPTPEQVQKIIEQASKSLSEDAKPAQIAFFGGSFTAIDRGYMVDLLESAQPYLDNYNFSGIRISTRPDKIDEDVLGLLKKYHVRDIELGAQSMNDAVLRANFRGHTAMDTIATSKLIKAHGFGLGLQMMTGLYTDNTESTLDTARQIIDLKPDSVRIYPTVILRGTTLAKLYNNGKYTPQTIEDAVGLCADLLETFTDSAVPVIRLGLHDSPEFRRNIVSGPHHPAFRELCENRVLLRKVLRFIEINALSKRNVTLTVAPGAVSKMAGQKRGNLRVLEDMGYPARIRTDTRIGYIQVEVS